MKKQLYKFFMLDDRTNLPSSSKFVRVNSWILGVFYVFAGMGFIYFGGELSDNSIKMMDNLKEFLIFLIPTTEASYQFNRNNKMKNGSAPLIEAEAEAETEEEEEVPRKRVDL